MTPTRPSSPTPPGDPRRRPGQASALALAIGDGLLDSTWSTHWTRARVHLEFLQRHGYVLSDAERQELDRATAGDDPEAEAGE